MGNDSGLVETFPVARVTVRCFITFVGALGGAQVLAGYWQPAETARAWLFSEPLATPGLFLAFYAMFLVTECINRVQREAMEKMRSNPTARRKAQRSIPRPAGGSRRPPRKRI